MVPLVNQLLPSLTDVSAPVTVDRDVRLEGVMLLEKSLDSGHVVAEVGDCEELLLLTDPGLLLLYLGQELLVDDGLLKLPPSLLRHLLQLLPDVSQLLQPLLYLGPTQGAA